MNRVKLSSLNFQKIDNLYGLGGGESTLYSRNHDLIKIYYESVNKERKMQALESMDGVKIDNVIIPHSIVEEDNDEKKAAGCIMDYYPKAKKLVDFFDEYVGDSGTDIFISFMRNASLTLKEIHRNGLVCGDVSFTNILYLPDLTHLFCDFDGAVVNGFGSFSRTLDKYRSCRWMDNPLDMNTDKISLYLMFLCGICGDSFVSKLEYESFCWKYPFLEDAKAVYKDVFDAVRHYPNIPYLDEIIPSQYKIIKK